MSITIWKAKEKMLNIEERMADWNREEKKRFVAVVTASHSS